MQTVTFIAVPPSQEVYLDMVCGSAEDNLAILENAAWATISKGTIKKLRAAGTPHSVDMMPYAKKGLRVTITSGE